MHAKVIISTDSGGMVVFMLGNIDDSKHWVVIFITILPFSGGNDAIVVETSSNIDKPDNQVP